MMIGDEKEAQIKEKNAKSQSVNKTN